MSDRWIGVAPVSAEADLHALVESGAPSPEGERLTFVRTEWPWRFEAGKLLSFDTPRGTTLSFANITIFGHLAVTIDDRDGLIALLTSRLPLEDVARLAKRSEAAASDHEKLDALLALASAQSIAGVQQPLAAFEAAARRALDDTSPVVRLAGIRAIAILPPATSLSLLKGRKDRENPGLAEWRKHYQRLLSRS